jgi:chemotaxis protein histidine kinase CheA
LGANKFIFDCPAPDASRIPQSDLMEVTVILLTCSYRDAEFIRIGYYVNNDYPQDQIALKTERQQWLDECNRIRNEQQLYLNAQAEAKQLQQQQQSAQNGTETTQSSQVNTSGDMDMCNSNEATPAAASNTTTSNSTSSSATPNFTLPPQPHVHIEALYREILADKPRVTRFQIDWNSEEMRQQLAQQRAAQQLQQQQQSSSSSSAAASSSTMNNAGEYEMSTADRLAAEQSARQTEVEMAVRRTDSGHIVSVAHERSQHDAKDDDDEADDDDDDDGMADGEEDDSEESDSSELAEVYELVDADENIGAAPSDLKENRAPIQQQQQQQSSAALSNASLQKPSASMSFSQQVQAMQQQQQLNTSGSMMD